MLSGITTRWKQTIAYYLTGNSVKGHVFKPIILTVLRKSHDIGIHVISVTSDMGSSNQAMWKSFGIVCSRFSEIVNKIPHPCVPERYLYFMADVPHVIKNLKASMINGNTITLTDDIANQFNLDCRIINVEPVKALVSFQKDKDLKLAPKLNEASVNPSHFEKMKESHALNFFSHSVSSSLQYLVQHEGHNSNYLTTAWFLELCDRWFNLMSSRHPVMALSKINMNSYENAILHLNSVISVFQYILFGKKGHWKPVQTCIILTTTSMLEVHRELLDNGHTFVLTSRFTQDCLENLFGCVRLKNPVPSALEFKQALKSITVAQFLKRPSSGSYQDDDSSYLAEFLNHPTVPSSSTSNTDVFNQIDYECSANQSLEQSESNRYYLGGYCVLQIKKNDKHILFELFR